jgi:hypothetical protein
MRHNNIPILFFLSLITAVTLFSCQKDDSKLPYGFSKIYMPQAIVQSGGVNNNYPVPSGTDSSTYNYSLDTKSSKLNVVLGALLSGPASGAYSVGIQVNNDTIQQLFAAKVFDTALYKLMPAAMYTIPTQLDVAAGARGGTFNLGIDIGMLKSNAYAGKYLVLAVKIVKPTQYTLDTALSTTIVVVNVNSLVIGPAVDVTMQYVLNPGNPFISSAMNGTRWGSLKSWNVNAAAASHGGVGGYGTDGDGQTMDIESGWGSPAIYNGKVYQTFNLPAGTYSFDPSGGTWKWQGTLDPTYAVVAPAADTLPDYSNIVNNSSVMYQVIANDPQPKVNFQLTAPGKVTIGIVINYIKDQQGFKSTKVSLFNYPKHL